MLPGEPRRGSRPHVFKPELNMFEQMAIDYNRRRFVLVKFATVDELGRPRTLKDLLEMAKCMARCHFYTALSDNSSPAWYYCRAVHISIEYIPFDKYIAFDKRPPPRIETILRSQLVELRRLKDGVDVCVRDISTDKKFGSENHLVFKYYYRGSKARLFWNEVTTLLALPAHLPNVLPIKHLVLDETTNSGVVGFTMPFITSGDLGRWCENHPIKWKWVRQLMLAVDRLNLAYGVSHGDIGPRNILLDSEFDEVYLCDFAQATPMELAVPQRNDVKGVLLTVFELLTRDPRCKHGNLAQMNEYELVGAGRSAWTLHSMARLEGNVTVDDIYTEVTSWATLRRKAPVNDNGVPIINTPGFEWKPFPGSRYERERITLPNCPILEQGFEDNIFCGEVLDWTRPSSNNAQLAPGRRLLATGRYENEAAPASKRTCLRLCLEQTH